VQCTESQNPAKLGVLIFTFEVRQLCLNHGQRRAGDRKQALIEPGIALDETTARDIQLALKLVTLSRSFCSSVGSKGTGWSACSITLHRLSCCAELWKMLRQKSVTTPSELQRCDT